MALSGTIFTISECKKSNVTRNMLWSSSFQTSKVRLPHWTIMCTVQLLFRHAMVFRVWRGDFFYSTWSNLPYKQTQKVGNVGSSKNICLKIQHQFADALTSTMHKFVAVHDLWASVLLITELCNDEVAMPYVKCVKTVRKAHSLQTTSNR